MKQKFRQFTVSLPSCFQLATNHAGKKGCHSNNNKPLFKAILHVYVAVWPEGGLISVMWSTVAMETKVRSTIHVSIRENEMIGKEGGELKSWILLLHPPQKPSNLRIIRSELDRLCDKLRVKIWGISVTVDTRFVRGSDLTTTQLQIRKREERETERETERESEIKRER